jgi:hypothetical protein
MTTLRVVSVEDNQLMLNAQHLEPPLGRLGMDHGPDQLNADLRLPSDRGLE